jgi:hypothetical protein
MRAESPADPSAALKSPGFQPAFVSDPFTQADGRGWYGAGPSALGGDNQTRNPKAA